MPGQWKRALLLWALALWTAVPALVAQPTRTLVSGETRADTLSVDQVAQVYTFSGAQDAQVNLQAEAEEGTELTILLTNAAGETLMQGAGTVMEGFRLPAEGRYYVTVLAAGGLPEGGMLDFDLSFAQEAAPVDAATEEAATEVAEPFAPGEVLAISGLQIQLQWDSLANLDLEVRDPVGGSVYFARPATESGGLFGVNMNSVCETRSNVLPTEQVNWSAGSLPTGSYEILVYNQSLDDCPTVGTADFRIDARLDDRSAPSMVGSLAPGATWVTSLRVDAEGALRPGAGGVATDAGLLPADAVAQLQQATPLTRGVPQTGLLTSSDFLDVYSFQGRANELVTVNMAATSGSLDTLLQLLDSNGTVLAANDDLEDGQSTNSTIRNQRLLADGEYSIVATRYGKELGGTEGHYELLLSGPAGDLPQEVLSLGLPRGDLEIALSWNTNADLQLLVRDPRGDSVYDDTPQIPGGGRLAAAGNVNCSASQLSPVSYVYWPEGTLTPGMYEVEVWHQNACDDTRPVSFVLSVLANGVPVYTGAARPVAGQVYITSFIVGVDQQVEAREGGFIGIRGQGLETLSLASLDFRADLEDAPLLTSGERVSGSITIEDVFDVYAFDGQAGEVISASMVRTAGRLDTVLVLLDPQGYRLADNDDAVVGEGTDSLLRELVLPEDGRYYLLATHFGLGYGGTTGTYDLLYSRLGPG